MWKKLWADEGGAILSAELILLMTIMVIGVTVGLKALQVAIVTELGDVAQALGAMNQSFSFSGTSQTTGATSTAGASFTDALDVGDQGSTQTSGGTPQGISVAETPTSETAAI